MHETAKKPYVFGQNNCPFAWERMDKTTDPAVRLCSGCQKPVFDIRNKSREEARALYQQQQGDLCATGLASQKNYFNAERWHQKLMHRSGLLGLLTIAMLWGREVKAQIFTELPKCTELLKCTELPTIILTGFTSGNDVHLNDYAAFPKWHDNQSTYELQQSASSPKGSFFVSGSVMQLRKGMKHIPCKDLSVFILSEEGVELMRTSTNDRGEFSLILPTHFVGEKFSVQISYEDFNTITEPLRVADTHIRFTLPPLPGLPEGTYLHSTGSTR